MSGIALTFYLKYEFIIDTKIGIIYFYSDKIMLVTQILLS